MRIVCLAWGSLVWKAEPLEPVTDWMRGGPALPIELGYVGDKGEVATVLSPGVPDMPTRWARLRTGDLHDARESLRVREGIPADRPERVGHVATSEDSFDGDVIRRRIAEWGRLRAVDAVIWTALEPRRPDRQPGMPTVEESIRYLASLHGHERAHARTYLRLLPDEIRTRYRTAIEDRLGWAPATHRFPPAGHVVVHGFRIWRRTHGAFFISGFKGTVEAVMKIKGAELIPDSAEDVPQADLDAMGFVPAPSAPTAPPAPTAQPPQAQPDSPSR